MNPTLNTLYDILEVDQRARPETLRKAYRRLARAHHPDINPDPKSHEQMAKINAAFETLIDPVRRMEYDATINGGMIADPEPDFRPSRQPDAVTVRISYRLRDHKTPIYSLSFAPDTGYLISSSFDNELIWWDLSEGVQRRHLKVEGGVVSTVQALREDKVVAAGCSESMTSAWHVDGEQVTATKHNPIDWACCVKVSNDGKKVAVGSVHHNLQIRKSFASEAMFEANGHHDSVTSVTWSNDARLVATGSADATVKLWSSANGKEVHTFPNVRSTVTALCFSPDSRYLAVAAVDLSIRVFDIATLTLSKTLFGHERPIESLAFHPCGWLLGSVGRDGRVGLWDVNSGIGHGKIEASHMPLSCLAFSPDGKHMAAGGLDKVLRVWDLNIRS